MLKMTSQTLLIGAHSIPAYTSMAIRSLYPGVKNMTGVGYVMKRSPNLKEHGFTVAVTSLFKTLAVTYKSDATFLGHLARAKNPNDSSAFEDLGGVAVALMFMIAEVSHGDTRLLYGVGDIISAFLKPTCKFGMMYLGFGATLANLVCEPLAALFVIVEKDCQKDYKNELSYSMCWVKGLQDNRALEWVSRAVSYGTTKASMSYGFNKLWAEANLGEVLQKGVEYLHTHRTTLNQFLTFSLDGLIRAPLPLTLTRAVRDTMDYWVKVVTAPQTPQEHTFKPRTGIASIDYAHGYCLEDPIHNHMCDTNSVKTSGDLYSTAPCYPHCYDALTCNHDTAVS